MIQILETNVKIGMTMPEFRVLVKVLGAQSHARLMADDGLTEREAKVYDEIYVALKVFLAEYESR